jgi:UDP-N-acetylglucosamine 3-dehydrogenase
MLKVGLVGAGGIARPHMAAFVRNAQVEEVHVADPSAEARKRLSDEFGIIKGAAREYGELLADESIDLIDICTPHYLHHPIAVAALKAGKHVITEKPIATNLKQADEMIAAAKRAKKRLFVALCQRMFPAHIEAKRIIEAGEIGAPFLGIANVVGNEFERMNDPDSWKGDWKKAGGGALIDTGYHAVYMLQHFLGPARAVTAMTKRLRVEPKQKADDTSVVALEMSDRAMASIVVTYCATGDRWSESRQIIGDKGSLLIRDNPEDEVPLIAEVEGQLIPVKVHNPLSINPYGIRQTLDHFIECILQGRASEITNAEARAALATVLAAYRSEREGRRVEVSEVEPASGSAA